MATATLELRADSRQVRTATKDLNRLEREGRNTTSTVSTLRNAFVALGGALAIQRVIRYADAYTSVQNQLRIVTDTTEELTNIQERLLGVANNTRSELESTAGLYATLARNTTELNLSQDRLVRITDIINKSFAASGASAQEASGAIRQLSQGLAAGALRGDEFNSVAEGAPEILRAVAAETGKTIGQLREFAAEGGITAELLIRSLENYGTTIDEIFEKSERTFGQSLTVANNNLTTFIGGMNSASGATGLLGDGIVSLSENLDELLDVTLVIGTAFAGRFVAGQVAAAASMVRTVSAATGLRTAMSFLGGPVGIIAGATTALALYTSEIETAQERQESYKTSVSELAAEFQKLSDNVLGTKLKQAQQDYNELNSESIELLKEEARLVAARDAAMAEGGATAAVDEQRALREVQGLLQENEQARAALQKVIDAGFEIRQQETDATLNQAEASKASSEASKVEKSNFESLAQSLRAQIIEYELGKEAGDEYRLMSQLNAGVTREQTEEILALNDQLRASAQASREAAQAEAQRKRDMETGKTIGLSDEAQIQQQLNEQLIELERLKNEGLLSETESYTERRNNLIAEANERLASMQDQIEIVNWEAFENRAAGALAAVATGAQTGEDAVRSLAMGIAQEAVGALIKLGIQSVASTFLASSAEQSAKATSVATTAATMSATTAATTAAAAASTAAWTVPATLASIATLGGAAAAGTAALTAALGAGIAAATAASAASAAASSGVGAIGGIVGGRRQGGQVTAGNTYLVGEDGPETISMGGSGRVTPFNQLMQQADNSTTNENRTTNANITFQMPEDNGAFRERVLANRDVIYNVVSQALNEQGREF